MVPNTIFRRNRPHIGTLLLGAASRNIITRQVDSNIDLSDGWSGSFGTGANEPTLVVRPCILTPGRTYTFSLTATDSSASVGYTGKWKLLLVVDDKCDVKHIQLHHPKYRGVEE